MPPINDNPQWAKRSPSIMCLKSSFFNVVFHESYKDNFAFKDSWSRLFLRFFATELCSIKESYNQAWIILCGSEWWKNRIYAYVLLYVHFFFFTIIFTEIRSVQYNITLVLVRTIKCFKIEIYYIFVWLLMKRKIIKEKKEKV